MPKQVQLAGCFVFILFIVISASAQQRQDSLKVMTYNIHHANPPSVNDSIDLDAIAGVIIKQQPHLVALQEVDVNTGRSGKSVNQAAVLADKTGMQYYFAKAIDHDGGDYGVAILSRYPISSGQTHRLPTLNNTGGEPRVLATAVITLPSKKKIVFASTHFDAQQSDTNRMLQIRTLTKILKKEKLPVVVAGDFNAEPSSEVISILDKQLTRTCMSGCGFTIPQINASKTIDYIAFTPGVFKVLGHEVINEPYASDHLPVVAILK